MQDDLKTRNIQITGGDFRHLSPSTPDKLSVIGQDTIGYTYQPPKLTCTHETLHLERDPHLLLLLNLQKFLMAAQNVALTSSG